MPNVYDSDVHLPRWKRAVFWLFESPTGIALWGIPVLFLLFAPSYWFGAWWLIVIVVAGMSFALGWSAARRKMLRDGWVNKL